MAKGVGQPYAALVRTGLVEVLAPRLERHPEGLADPGDLGADLAQADDPERAGYQVLPHSPLPATGADRLDLFGEVASQPEDQCPGQLGRRVRGACGPGDDDAERAGS